MGGGVSQLGRRGGTTPNDFALRVEIEECDSCFQGLLIKKIRPLTLKVRVKRRILKKFKKYVGKMFKNSYFYFWQLLTCETCYYMHFSMAFKTYTFQPFSLINKSVINHFWFFFNIDPPFDRSQTYLSSLTPPPLTVNRPLIER